MKWLAVLLVSCSCCSGQVLFDGSDDYISQTDLLDPVTTSLTICAWTKQVITNGYQPIFWDRSGSSIGLRYEDGTRIQSYILNTGKEVTPNTDLTQWHHVTLTWDGSFQRIYLDGQYLGGDNVSGSVGDRNTAYVGADDYNSFSWVFNGILDDSRVYMRALSSNEIAKLFTTPWVLTDDPNLVLRTCIPGVWAESGVADISQNGHTATNHGGVLSDSSQGWSCFFDGSDDYLTASLPSPFGTDDFTIFFIADLRTNTYFRICPADNTTSAMGFPYICVYTNMITLQRDAAGSYKLDPYVSTGRTSYCYGRKSGIAFLYVNGQERTLVGSGSSYDQNGYSFSSGNFTVNRFYYNGTEYFYRGELHDLQIYDHALASNNIADLSQNISITNDPICHWTMQPAFRSTGSTLSGIAENMGTGQNGSYSGEPVVGNSIIRHAEPRHRVAKQQADYDTSLLYDISENEHTATNHGAELFETSAGWVADLSAAENDYLDMGLKVPPNNFSLIMTVRAKDTVATRLASQYVSGQAGRMTIGYGDVTSSAYRWTVGSVPILTGSVVTVDTTTTLGFWNSNTTWRFYTDGTLTDEQTGTDSVYQGTNLIVGTYSEGLYYNGYIYDIRLYEPQLTPTQMEDLSNITNQPTAHWTMQPSYR